MGYVIGLFLGIVVTYMFYMKVKLHKKLVVMSFNVHYGWTSFYEATVRWKYLTGRLTPAFRVRRRLGEHYWYDEDGNRIATIITKSLKEAKEKWEAKGLWNI